MSITWEGPPDSQKHGARGRHVAIAAELKARPGEWAKVLVDTSLGVSHQIKNAVYKAYQPAGSFEAVARNTRKTDGRTVCDVYARYIGDPPE